MHCSSRFAFAFWQIEGLVNSCCQALALSMAAEEEEMQKALQMSMGMDTESTPATSEPSAPTPAAEPAPTTPAPPSTGVSSLFKRILSCHCSIIGTPAAAPPAQLNDPSFVSSMLASLPGVDPNDPRIQAALKQISEKQTDDKKDGDKK